MRTRPCTAWFVVEEAERAEGKIGGAAQRMKQWARGGGEAVGTACKGNSSKVCAILHLSLRGGVVTSMQSISLMPSQCPAGFNSHTVSCWTAPASSRDSLQQTWAGSWRACTVPGSAVCGLLCVCAPTSTPPGPPSPSVAGVACVLFSSCRLTLFTLSHCWPLPPFVHDPCRFGPLAAGSNGAVGVDQQVTGDCCSAVAWAAECCRSCEGGSVGRGVPAGGLGDGGGGA